MRKLPLFLRAASRADVSAYPADDDSDGSCSHCLRRGIRFVLAAAAIISMAGTPMTTYAATFQTAFAGTGMNRHMTSCNGRTGDLNSLLNQMCIITGNRGSSHCGWSQTCGRSQ